MEHYIEGDHIPRHKDYCMCNEDNSICRVFCKVYTTVNKIGYIFYEGNVDRIFCYRAGKARCISLDSDGSKREVGHKGVGISRANPFGCIWRMYQNTDDRMVAFVYSHLNIALYQQNRYNVWLRCVRTSGSYALLLGMGIFHRAPHRHPCSDVYISVDVDKVHCR